MRTLLISIAIMSALSLSAQINTGPALITTNGSAKVYTVPNEVRMSFSIISQSDDIKEARDANSEKTKTVLDYLKGAGISQKHIQTNHLYVGKRYRHRHGDEENKYYEASQGITICIKDIASYEPIMIGLLENGVSNLSSPTFTTTELRSVKDEARKKAIKAAREKAEMLAAELGQSIGKAYRIDEVDVSNNWWSRSQNAYANTMTESNQSAPADDEQGFAAGQLEVEAKISVSFYLLEN